jgi:hypothetical protein
MFNYKFFVIIIFLLGVNLMGCVNSYPKIFFTVTETGDPIPIRADERFESGEKYPQEITFFFSQPDNTFIKYFVPIIFVNKPYRTLYVHKMSYEYDMESGVFMEGKSFSLPNMLEKDGWFYTIGIRQRFFGINLEKLFLNKKIDDEFMLKIVICYSFDDEAVKEQVLEYKVKAFKGEYLPFWLGW